MTKEQYVIRGTKVKSPYPAQLTPAEVRLVFVLQKFFRPEMILADYYLPKLAAGRKAENVATMADLVQIDCLAIDRRGVFVFESKDYVGWVYAHGERVHWTQVSGYGKNKQQFYSPVKQNMAHIKALRELCGGEVPIFSWVVFGREATLKVVENMPEDCRVVRQTELRVALTDLNLAEKLSESELMGLRGRLEAGRINPTTLTRAEHVAEVREVAERAVGNAG